MASLPYMIYRYGKLLEYELTVGVDDHVHVTYISVPLLFESHKI